MRLPRWRKASREQVQAHDEAVRALWDYGRQQARAGNHDETAEYNRLNGRVNQLRQPLSPVQRSLPATMHRVDRIRDQERRRSR